MIDGFSVPFLKSSDNSSLGQVNSPTCITPGGTMKGCQRYALMYSCTSVQRKRWRAFCCFAPQSSFLDIRVYFPHIMTYEHDFHYALQKEYFHLILKNVKNARRWGVCFFFCFLQLLSCFLINLLIILFNNHYTDLSPPV